MRNNFFLSYYKNEIDLLRELGKEYSKKQPLLASYLSETSNDPDTERLIEATAFLNANLKKELNESFDLFSYELIDIIYPDVVKSKPSISIVEITPTSDLSEKLEVKKGTYVNSKRVDKAICKFRSTWDMNIYPIKLSDIVFRNELDESSYLELCFNSSVNIDLLEMTTLDFFINMSLSNSYILAKMLMNDLKNITLKYDDKKIPLANDSLINMGFEEGNNLFSYNKKTLDRFKLLNEYFAFPRKNLFFRIKNLLKYTKLMNINKFSIVFNFEKTDANLLSMKQSSILLHSVPFINIFQFDTEPIKITYLNEYVKVVASYGNEDHYLVHEINEVKGLKNSKTKKNIYIPFNHFTGGEYVYKFFIKKSLGDFRRENGYLQLFYKNSDNIDDILTVDANVTNGSLCETLQIGDICFNSENSPEYCTFENITIPSTYIESPVENDKLTFILSHISTNIFGINDIEDFKNILKFYVADYSRDKEGNTINLKKISSLSKLAIENIMKLKDGFFVNAKVVNISLDSSYFANSSDMYLFAFAIFNFFKLGAAINSFVYLTALDTYSGERFLFS